MAASMTWGKPHWTTGSATTSNCVVTWNNTTNTCNWSSDDWIPVVSRDVTIRPGDKRDLPDGSKLIVDDLGNYRIEDKDAQVTYRANRVREFSPHLNASDMVAQFVEYVGKLGVRQTEVLNLPLELFINWLVISAAERDHDPLPDGIVRVEQHVRLLEVKHPRCLFCQRFISRQKYEKRFQFCGLEHCGRWLLKTQGETRKLTASI